jgi:hypothetical protein
VRHRQGLLQVQLWRLRRQMLQVRRARRQPRRRLTIAIHVLLLLRRLLQWRLLRPRPHAHAQISVILPLMEGAAIHAVMSTRGRGQHLLLLLLIRMLLRLPMLLQRGWRWRQWQWLLLHAVVCCPVCLTLPLWLDRH